MIFMRDPLRLRSIIWAEAKRTIWLPGRRSRSTWILTDNGFRRLEYKEFGIPRSDGTKAYGWRERICVSGEFQQPGVEDYAG